MSTHTLARPVRTEELTTHDLVEAAMLEACGFPSWPTWRFRMDLLLRCRKGGKLYQFYDYFMTRYINHVTRNLKPLRP